MIRVGVCGAGGRMGSAVCDAVNADVELELTAKIDPTLGSSDNEFSSLENLPSDRVDVVVDFTIHDAALANLGWCAANGVHAVVGTSGFTGSEITELSKLFEQSKANALIAPNFAIGAVLMMRFAEMAAPHFDSAEVIELHHEQKADAPSGTAMLTAQRMAAASSDWSPDPTLKETVKGARGANVDGIPVHSARIHGMMAHQEVILGTHGQTLTIRHDSYGRESFMPGVLLAVKNVADHPGLTFGLDALLSL